MNKKFNTLMLIMLIAQYIVPPVYVASEIQSYVSELSSEEKQSSSEGAETESEVSEVASETSEVESATSEMESEALTPEELETIATAVAPDTQIQVMPYPAFNVINFDAPPGYFVPEESTLYGYRNGHMRVSIEDGTFRDVPPQGYLDLGDGGKGYMDPETGLITHDGCGSTDDDKIRFQCSGMFFPLDTTYGGGQGYTSGTNEHSIANSDTITIYYPEALDVNGTKYDIKAKFTDFVKMPDSLGNNNDGWFTTFAVSHYLYNGYWLNDFPKVIEEMQIFNSETKEPVNLADLKVYDFRLGMLSLNHSVDDYGYASNLTAEVIRPLDGLDDSTADTMLLANPRWL